MILVVGLFDHPVRVVSTSNNTFSVCMVKFECDIALRKPFLQNKPMRVYIYTDLASIIVNFDIIEGNMIESFIIICHDLL
jgi:hypothetical protein